MASKTDRKLVVDLFDACRYPGGDGPSLETAWLGIYQVLWWYEHGVIHLREANDLKKAIWRQRAKEFESYFAAELGVETTEVPQLVDRMLKTPRWEGKQRNNPLGHGLRMLVSEVFRRWGAGRFSYPEEAPADLWFPGIQMPGRSSKPRVDVAAVRDVNGRPRAIFSCKWSIRHDRISDPTNECTQYKSAAVQLQLMNLQYFVVTNELSSQRIDKVLNQPCIDGLVHVHLDAANRMPGAPTALMTAARAARRLFDLTEIVDLTRTWM